MERSSEGQPIPPQTAGLVNMLNHPWRRLCLGGGQIHLTDATLRLTLPETHAGAYSDAQLDDYSGLRLRQFPWRPPLRLTLRARASHAAHPATPAGIDSASYLRGTAGFGFWNNPISAAGGALRLPDAIWFFASAPPSNIALRRGVAGWGWKAQVVRAHRIGAVAAGAATIGAIAWGRLTGDQRAAAHWVERLTGAHEAPLDAQALHDWRTYTLEWERDIARFWVDDALALAVLEPPQGPLGCVLWIDNQFAVATPGGALRFGVVATERQWLEIEGLRINV